MISVIIPTYNRALFLKEAIQSVLDQNCFAQSSIRNEFELIVIDDGSTDNTRKTVETYCSSDSRVKFHFLEHAGVSAARNLGLRTAKGEFIAFLDSDDLWKKEKISVQMSYLKTFPEARVCYTEEVWIRRGVFVNPKKQHRKYSGWIFDRVLPLCLISLSSALFHREVFEEVGDFDEELPACEDYDFGIRVAHRYPLHLITKPLIVKRGGHPGQLSREYWGMDRFRIKALEKAQRMDLTPEQDRLIRLEIVKKCRIMVQGCQKRNKEEDARTYLALIEKYGSSSAAGGDTPCHPSR